MTATQSITVRIYVGTYKKYNEGSLFGKWLDLSDYDGYDEFIQACKELHNDEADPELMFQDMECPAVFESMGMISENHISKDIYKVIEAFEGAGYDTGVYLAYWSHVGSYDDIEELIEQADEAYEGEFDSDVDFAEDFAEGIGAVDSNAKWPHTCIDWEYAARELMYDYFEEEGHYFRHL